MQLSKSDTVIDIIEISYVFKIGKVDLAVLTLLYSLTWTFLPMLRANLSLACIKMQLRHVH